MHIRSYCSIKSTYRLDWYTIATAEQTAKTRKRAVMVMSVPSSSPPATAAPYVVEDCGDTLQVLSDGTIVRSAPPPAPVPDDGRVQWKDALYDADRGLGLRMYRPRRRDVTDT
jgi:hypothetical protein